MGRRDEQLEGNVLMYVTDSRAVATPPGRMHRSSCPRGSVVEHFLGKEGVASSILAVGLFFVSGTALLAQMT